MNEDTFNGIIGEDEFYFSPPDPYFTYEAYRMHFEQAFRISKGFLNLDKFAGFDEEKHFHFEITVNGQAFTYKLERQGKFFNSEFYLILNDLLAKLNYEGVHSFIDLNAHDFDVSIGFITKEQELELATKGFIWRPPEFFPEPELTPEEIARKKKFLREALENALKKNKK